MKKEKIYATAEEAERISEDKVSSCCGARDRSINGDSSFSDHGLCSDCSDHTEYEHQDDDGNVWQWDKERNEFYR